MADALKVLGQSAPPATTLTPVYAPATGKSATVSTISVCNRGGTATAFRISVAPAGAADDPSQYLYYDLPISANNTFQATAGITLAEDDEVRFYAGNGNLSISLFGVEVS